MLSSWAVVVVTYSLLPQTPPSLSSLIIEVAYLLHIFIIKVAYHLHPLFKGGQVFNCENQCKGFLKPFWILRVWWNNNQPVGIGLVGKPTSFFNCTYVVQASSTLQDSMALCTLSSNVSTSLSWPEILIHTVEKNCMQ